MTSIACINTDIHKKKEQNEKNTRIESKLVKKWDFQKTRREDIRVNTSVFGKWAHRQTNAEDWLLRMTISKRDTHKNRFP